MPHEQRRRIKTRVYSVCVRVSILAQQANCSKACDKVKIPQWYNSRSESRWPRDNQGATRQGRSTEKVCPSKALTAVAHFLQPGSTFFIFFSFFLLLEFFFFKTSVYVWPSFQVHVICVGTCRGQKMSEPLELESQAVVRRLL